MNKHITRLVAFLLCLAIVAGLVPSFELSLPPVSAATASYDDYNDVSFIYNLGDCPSMQGMAIHGNYIYCAKVNTETETSAIITRTNKNTGESTYMVDTGTGSNFLRCDHQRHQSRPDRLAAAGLRLFRPPGLCSHGRRRFGHGYQLHHRL